MPLRCLVKTAITVVTPPVDFNSFPPTRHTRLPQYNRHWIAVGSPFYFFAIARRLYCGGTVVMEVLLRFLYGTTAVMAVPRRSWLCRGDPTAAWPNPRWHCGSFEHVQSFRRVPAKVRSFDSFPRCYDDQ